MDKFEPEMPFREEQANTSSSPTVKRSKKLPPTPVEPKTWRTRKTSRNRKRRKYTLSESSCDDDSDIMDSDNSESYDEDSSDDSEGGQESRSTGRKK